MFASTRSNHRMLAAAIGVNLLLAVVVGIGMTVRPVNAGALLPSRPASVGAVSEVAVETGQAAAQQAGTGTPGSASAGAGAVKTGRPGSPAAAASGGAAGAEAAAAATLAAAGRSPAAGVVVPRPAPRVEPSRTALRAAIRELDARTNYFRPTENQVRDFSGQVCTAFDQGYAYPEVKAAVLDSAKRAPYLGISTADADYAIRSSVQLFCPGYAPLLP